MALIWVPLGCVCVRVFVCAPEQRSWREERETKEEGECTKQEHPGQGGSVPLSLPDYHKCKLWTSSKAERPQLKEQNHSWIVCYFICLYADFFFYLTSQFFLLIRPASRKIIYLLISQVFIDRQFPLAIGTVVEA